MSDLVIPDVFSHVKPEEHAVHAALLTRGYVYKGKDAFKKTAYNYYKQFPLTGVTQPRGIIIHRHCLEAMLTQHGLDPVSYEVECVMRLENGASSRVNMYPFTVETLMIHLEEMEYKLLGCWDILSRKQKE